MFGHFLNMGPRFFGFLFHGRKIVGFHSFFYLFIYEGVRASLRAP